MPPLHQIASVAADLVAQWARGRIDGTVQWTAADPSGQDDVPVMDLALPGGRTFSREGVVEGRITEGARGDSGFGYDPVFELPDGRTMAEIGEQKQRISHRALAMHAMMDVLRELA